MQEFQVSLQVFSDGVGLIFSISVLPLGKANLSLMKPVLQCWNTGSATTQHFPPRNGL